MGSAPKGWDRRRQPQAAPGEVRMEMRNPKGNSAGVTIPTSSHPPSVASQCNGWTGCSSGSSNPIDSIGTSLTMPIPR